MEIDKKRTPVKKRKKSDKALSLRRTENKIKNQFCEDEKTTDKILRSFFELGQLIGLDLNLEEMVLQIAQKAVEVMEADRYSLFLYDPKTNELWTRVAVGMEGVEIRIPVEEGVSGYSYRTGETVNLSDAYSDPRFYRQGDIETNYKTKTLLSMPFYSRSGKILGIIQLTNKKNGVFTKEDEVFLRMFNNHAAVFIEMAQLQKARFDALEQSKQELEKLSRAKDKALAHLSHELRTPLSVIMGTIKIIKRKMEANDISSRLDNSFKILERNLERLSAIQHETDKIIRMYQEIDEGIILGELDRLWRQLKDVSEVPDEIKLYWDTIKKWISDNLHGRHVREKIVNLVPFIKEKLEQVKKYSSHRDLTFQTEFRGDVSLLIIPGIHEKILEGLLRNAVENTPDNGLIRVILSEDEDKISLRIRDFGIGITQENQEHIFDGFFHARDTDLYSSKEQYDFGAGGKGLDLMVARIYGRRFGFQLTFESRRCVYIPTESDICPGKISLCKFCKSKDDCIASGGSTFTLSFPINKKICK